MKLLQLITICLILPFLAASCGEKKSGSIPENPNILFIAVDDLRPELACYGATHISSPNIDQLAAEGTRFDRSYCNIPVCGASRASLLTGLRPMRKRFLHYYDRADELAPHVASLPMHFRNNGYHTISNGKVYHHDNDSEDSWDELWHPASASSSWRDYVLKENDIRDVASDQRGMPYEREDVPDNAYKDGKTAEKVISDLARLKEEGKPFFLAAGFLKPHLPFNAPEKYWKLYDGKIRLPENDYAPENAPKEAIHTWGELRAYDQIPEKGRVSDEMAESLIHGYYASVSYIDAQIGKILRELERLELDRNTIVVLWGDHGWNLREHGLWCKHCNFANALHTPMILRVPGKEQVASTSEIVEYVDIYPTLCELAGLDLPDHLQGDSFSELLFNEDATTDGVAVCQWFKGIKSLHKSVLLNQKVP